MPTPPKASKFHAQLSVVAARTGLVAGEASTIGISFQMKGKWHVYWPGQNDSGIPPEGKLTALIDGKELDGVTFGDWEWPAPYRHVVGGEVLDHVYYERLTIVVPVTIPASAVGKTVTIKADMNWLVCDEACVLEKGSAELTLPVVASADKDSLRPGPGKEHLDQSMSKMPKPLASLSAEMRPQARRVDDVVELRFPDTRQLAFMPHDQGVRVTNALGEGEVSGDTLKIEIDPDEPGSSPESTKEPRLKGVANVMWRLHTVPTPFQIDVPLSALSDQWKPVPADASK